MSDAIDLTGVLAEAIDTATGRGRPVTLAYVDEEGRPRLSIRGSTHVHDADRLAIWARSADRGLVPAIAERPDVSVLYFASDPAVPKMLLTLRGRARVEPSLSEAVYARLPESERDRDPRAEGVAVIVEVDEVDGMRAEGPIVQRRAAGGA